MSNRRVKTPGTALGHRVALNDAQADLLDRRASWPHDPWRATDRGAPSDTLKG